MLLTLAFCLVRAKDQPGVGIGVAGTTATVVPGDVALAALAVVALAELMRRGLPRVTWLALGSAFVFSVLVLTTAASNGSSAFVSGVKVTELTALGLGAFALVRTTERLDAIVDVLLIFVLVADVVGLIRFVGAGGGRQASFLGAHDFAALGTLLVLYGLTLVIARHRTRRAVVAIVAGSVGCILAAALASLLGLYLGAAILLGVAALRRHLDLRGLVVTAAVLVAVTGGTVELRSGDLGFLQSWFGKPASTPGQYASGWSQRLIYAYIGGKIFIDHPVLGTGWYGDLPPSAYARYLPDARRRFSDQPPRYFPQPNDQFIPQQTFDEVLYELGIAGGLAMLGLLAGLGQACVRAARKAAGAFSPLPAAWLAAMIGALAGEGLFGGAPLAAMFWLVAGVALAFAAMTEATG
jgi:hypothetical protein